MKHTDESCLYTVYKNDIYSKIEISLMHLIAKLKLVWRWKKLNLNLVKTILSNWNRDEIMKLAGRTDMSTLTHLPSVRF